MENLLRRSAMQAVTKSMIGRMQERWVLETDRTAIAMRQGLAWMMPVFFMVALIAYVIVRWSQINHQKP